MKLLAYIAIMSAGVLSLIHQVHTATPNVRSGTPYALVEYKATGSPASYTISPSYTPQALNSGRFIEGNIQLDVQSDRLGDVNMVYVRQGLGYGLNEEAVQAVRQWRFEPTGKPEKHKVTIHYTSR